MRFRRPKNWVGNGGADDEGSEKNRDGLPFLAGHFGSFGTEHSINPQKDDPAAPLGKARNAWRWPLSLPGGAGRHRVRLGHRYDTGVCSGRSDTAPGNFSLCR